MQGLRKVNEIRVSSLQLVTFSAATALLQLSPVVCFLKRLLSLKLERTLQGRPGPEYWCGWWWTLPAASFLDVLGSGAPRPPCLLAPLAEKQEALKWEGILPGSWPQGLLLLLLFNADASPWTACIPCVGPLEG